MPWTHLSGHKAALCRPHASDNADYGGSSPLPDYTQAHETGAASIADRNSTEDEEYDMICVGFGPAALAIAVALHDKKIKARVLFLERQAQFAWHAGMLLPDARMQISFLKDLATLRDPRSPFTFLNYLKTKGRLEAFINLSTFLPLREEFNDYLQWAAAAFKDQVRYGSEVVGIRPVRKTKVARSIISWKVTFRDLQTNRDHEYRARNVVIALGGKPKPPRGLEWSLPRLIHSSQYLQAVPRLLPRDRSKMRIAVLGGGQSAAEIFHNLICTYPQANVCLFIGDTSLRPSDDSPFVNEIFEATRVSSFYALPAHARQQAISKDRATNYSVVRPALLEDLYAQQYRQRLHEPDPAKWRHRIIGSRELVSVSSAEKSSNLTNGHNEDQESHPLRSKPDPSPGEKLDLVFRNTSTQESVVERAWDLVLVGTGYVRDAHEHLLQDVDDVLDRDPETGRMAVARDYSVKTRPGKMNEPLSKSDRLDHQEHSDWEPDALEHTDQHLNGVPSGKTLSSAESLSNGHDDGIGSGIWLQGCCEDTHGLSDTLLSILATRSGELVDSIFGTTRQSDTA